MATIEHPSSAGCDGAPFADTASLPHTAWRQPPPVVTMAAEYRGADAAPLAFAHCGATLRVAIHDAERRATLVRLLSGRRRVVKLLDKTVAKPQTLLRSRNR